MSENPLKSYLRTEKVYVQLPTRGKLYEDGVVELTQTGEVGVMPMTATDELSIKNPDALLNGEGVVKAVQSCCRNVKNARKLFAPDFDAILLAIRAASYGDKYPIMVTCPECGHDNEFDISSSYMLEPGNMRFLDEEPVIEPQKGLKVYLRPYSFESITKIALSEFESNKLLRMIMDEETLTEDYDIEGLLSKYSNTFNKLVSKTVETLIDGIHKIEIMTEDGDKIVMENDEENRDYIFEWLSDVNVKTTDAIRENIESLTSDLGVNKKLDVECSECGHQWNSKLETNPAHFFG